jgi:peptidoglycan-N-acetylglucosamine deacetylase
MRFYQIPKWFRKLYPGAVWDFFLDQNQSLYITFDDGPNPATTPFILDLLDQYNAKATFFCLGQQVLLYPDLFEQIRARGHRIGNHGMLHLDGYKTSTEDYVKNASEAAGCIPSSLYRPAYGRIKKTQYNALKKQGFQFVFWSLLTYDFDNTLSSEKRLELIRKKTKAGSILVFHDSEKAFPQLKNELPVLLKEWKEKGFAFKAIHGE